MKNNEEKNLNKENLLNEGAEEAPKDKTLKINIGGEKDNATTPPDPKESVKKEQITEIEERKKEFNNMGIDFLKSDKSFEEETTKSKKEIEKHEALAEGVKSEIKEKKDKKGSNVKVNIDDVVVPKKRYTDDLQQIAETISNLNEKINIEKETELEKKEAEKKKNRKTARIATIIAALAVFILLVPYPTGKAFSINTMISFFRDIFGNGAIASVESVEGPEITDPTIRDSGNNDAVGSGGLSSISNSDKQNVLNKISEGSRVYCIISSSPYFSSIEEKGALFISNPKESVFHTQVVIEEKSTEEEMYISSLLAPDEKVEYDYLTNKNYAEGEYVAMAYFNYYQPDENKDGEFNYTGTVSVEILIKIGR